ncbi:YitT family protein [Edaphobacillus lindanitolerans]|uniref:Uncharacterized membrane-anchored protein YitT, contains DUF161 and DUF2179 domains n=1 Tax=Edaphobacillus lindanitolerans TaxID=550447 RepID=A0A1U7PM48_9BACI|nr:YitT family protein [Edaphobacillus lindanitolerans]SIT89238.1 Uncharacterized membrane-anchored protein YitT, contains DUF161 and DUF2179 domains [Edaphobacillus lindanitolerans]
MGKQKRVADSPVAQFIMITIGAVIAAIGLQLFLVPNAILDGGVIGLSIIFSEMTPISLSIFIILLNIPFLFLGYKRLGLKFTIEALYGIVVLSIATKFFEQFEVVTQDLFLSTIIGAVVLGVGVGLVIRTGGALDGTEILAILISKRRSISVGQIVMIMNVFIFTLAGLLVFTWETTFYSMITYFIASKVIDMVVEGLDESLSVMIISDKADELAHGFFKQIGRGVTFLRGEGAFTNDQKKVIYTVVDRLEMAQLRTVLRNVDPDAFVVVQRVNEISGSNFEKEGH